MKNRYDDKIKLLYMDTDCLIMEMRANDFYNDVKLNMLDNFDTSDYPKNNVYGIPLVNKKVLWKFKDELDGHIMEEFFRLRSKLYAYE